jgi:uncharacterized membrane protein (DUF106 family)
MVKEFLKRHVMVPLIKLLHFSLIIFVLAAPVSSVPGVLVLNATLTASLMTHWIGSSDVCCLSLAESYISGEPYKNTFIHSIVSPVYNLPETFVSKISWIITIISFIVSVSKLLKIFIVDKKEFNMKNLFSIIKI